MARFLLVDHAVEDLLDDLLGLGIEAGDDLGLEFEVVFRATLFLNAERARAQGPGPGNQGLGS